MGPSRRCGVCEVAASKYKCPSCLLPYCSLACFKKHKGTVPVALPKRSCQVDEESWVLKKEQLKYLVDTHEIRDALKNEELRNLICTIDCSEDPEDELEKAMRAPSFSEFAEKVLSIVSPMG